MLVQNWTVTALYGSAGFVHCSKSLTFSMNLIKSQIDRPLLLLEVSYVWGFRDSKYSEVLQSKDSQYTENEGSRGRGPATLVSEVI